MLSLWMWWCPVVGAEVWSGRVLIWIWLWQYKGKEHEDDLFNAFNEDGLMIGGVKVDINPITEGKHQDT